MMVASSRWWKLVLALGALAIVGVGIVAVLRSNSGGGEGPSPTWAPPSSSGPVWQTPKSSALSSPSGPRPTPPPTSSGPMRFSSCAQACAAGVAPMRRGDPDYDPRLDRNNDGIACERCP